MFIHALKGTCVTKNVHAADKQPSFIRRSVTDDPQDSHWAVQANYRWMALATRPKLVPSMLHRDPPWSCVLLLTGNHWYCTWRLHAQSINRFCAENKSTTLHVWFDCDQRRVLIHLMSNVRRLKCKVMQMHTCCQEAALIPLLSEYNTTRRFASSSVKVVNAK